MARGVMIIEASGVTFQGCQFANNQLSELPEIRIGDGASVVFAGSDLSPRLPESIPVEFPLCSPAFDLVAWARENENNFSKLRQAEVRDHVVCIAKIDGRRGLWLIENEKQIALFSGRNGDDDEFAITIGQEFTREHFFKLIGVMRDPRWASEINAHDQPAFAIEIGGTDCTRSILRRLTTLIAELATVVNPDDPHELTAARNECADLRAALEKAEASLKEMGTTDDPTL